MAGMLHDVGKLVVASKMPDVLKTVVERTSGEEQPMHRIEREELDTSHAEIGGYLLGIWGLPRAVVEAVANHHNPQQLSNPELDAVTAVHVADALVHELDADAGGRHFDALENGYLESVEASELIDEWRESIQDLFDPL